MYAYKGVYCHVLIVIKNNLSMKNMKVYLVLFIVAGAMLKSQSLVVNYEETVNVENYIKSNMMFESDEKEESISAVSKTLEKPKYYTLLYSDGESLYKKDNIKNNDEFFEATGGQMVNVSVGDFFEGVYKNHKSKLYLRDSDILGRKFLISDELTKIDWQLSNDEKTIGDYKVKKASSINERGENVVAWYAEDIPVPDGPYNYYGLPGLILELSTDSFNFNAVKITNSDTKIDIVKPSPKGKKKVNKTQYKKILFDKIEELKQDKGMIMGGKDEKE